MGFKGILCCSLFLFCRAFAFTVETLAIDDSFTSPVTRPVSALCVDSNGSIYVGGNYSNAVQRKNGYVIRLLPDGSYDPSFNIGTNVPGPGVRQIIVRHGLVYVRSFSYPDGQTAAIRAYDQRGALVQDYPVAQTCCGYAVRDKDFVVDERGGIIYVPGVRSIWPFIQRFHPNGQIDETFGANESLVPHFTDKIVNWFDIPPLGFFRIELQQTESGEKLLLAGNFTDISGTTLRNLARLEPNGAIDPTWNTNVSRVFDFAIDPEQRVYTLGQGLFGGTRRLDANGNLDSGFVRTEYSPGVAISNGELIGSGNVLFAFETDGHILACGTFDPDELGNFGACPALSLEPSGAKEPFFRLNVGPPGTFVKAVAAHSDGSMLAGGTFTRINGRLQPYLARFRRTRIEIPPAQLTVTKLRGKAIVSWPVYYETHRLEATRHPRRADRWMPVKNVPVEVGDTLYVTNRLARYGMNYQLVSPEGEIIRAE
jgi:hypothetical protein